jgi:uncharacterized protein YdhG (YjbR/CyaY superfamily)
MEGGMPGAATIDEYIAGFPSDVQDVLQAIRERVMAVVPDAQETMKYQMPTFTLAGKNVVHFAAWSKHVSLYAVPNTADARLRRDLAAYTTPKGMVKFMLGEPLPFELVDRLVAALVADVRVRTDD